jgi:hypothetical protein
MIQRLYATPRPAILFSRMVAKIAEADPHVMIHRVWHSHGNTESHNSVSHAKGVDVAVAQEQNAGNSSPNKGDRSKDWIRQMRKREETGRGKDRKHFARQQPQKT